MAGCAGIWIAIVAVSPSLQLLALGAGGGVITATLFLLLQSQQIRLRGLAETDPLTTLTNHGGFHDALEREIRHAGRTGSAFSIVTLDLDDFKQINDTHGHPYGDSVLRHAADRLRQAVRETDTAARVGGEEFAVLLPSTGRNLAFEIAERIRAAVSTVRTVDGELSCSAGVAVYPDDAAEPAELIGCADAALYTAKTHGKGRTREFEASEPATGFRPTDAAQIQRLLTEEGAIEIAYQPVVALDHGQGRRLRGTVAVPDRAGAPAFRLVRPSPRMRPRPRARGRRRARGARPDRSAPRNASGDQPQPVGPRLTGRDGGAAGGPQRDRDRADRARGLRRQRPARAKRSRACAVGGRESRSTTRARATRASLTSSGCVRTSSSSIAT